MWDQPESNVLTEFYSVGLVLLILLGITILLSKWGLGSRENDRSSVAVNQFNYGDYDGVFAWHRNLQFEGDIRHQSPINLQSHCARIIPALCQPLIFSCEYDAIPQELKVFNDGYSVIVSAGWLDKQIPTIYGGPLTEEYRFLNMRFRWGHNDFEGSEHMVDFKKYSMEIQVTFIKQKCTCANLKQAGGQGCIVIIAYLLQATPLENPFLQPIISALPHIRNVCSKFTIQRPPLPLSLITPAFQKDYFFYNGSLTHPPCSEGVKWIVLNEALNVSSRQVEMFRTLNGNPNGYIMSNIRPLQEINERDICYFT